MESKTLRIQVHLDGYIGHPYWPEMEKLINITKSSGMNRARTSANARKALEEYLEANGMALTDYEELKARAERPFYTIEVPDAPTRIAVPELHVTACIVQI